MKLNLVAVFTFILTVFICGTLNAQTKLTDFTFTELTDLPIDKISNTHFSNPIVSQQVINNSLYVFGGYLGANGGGYIGSDNIWKYNISTASWSDLGGILPYGALMSNGQAVYMNDSFFWGPTFATGNSNGWGSHKAIVEFNISAKSATEVADLRSASLWSVGAAPYNGIIYFFGGHDGSDNKNIWSYSPATNSVSSEGNMNVARGGASAIEVGGKIYIFGGRSVSQANTIEKFDPNTGTVSNINSSFGYTNPKGTIVFPWKSQDNKKIFLILQRENTLWELDLTSESLTLIGTLPYKVSATPGTYDSFTGDYYVLTVNPNDTTYVDQLIKISLNSSGNPCGDYDAGYQAGYAAGLAAGGGGSGSCPPTGSTTLNTDLSFSIPNASYKTLLGSMDLEVNFTFFGEQSGKLLWELESYKVK